MRKKALLLQKYLPSVACDFAATVNCLSRALGREKKGEIGLCVVDPIVVPAAQNYDFRAKSRAWQAATLANRVSSPSPCYLPPSLPISLSQALIYVATVTRRRRHRAFSIIIVVILVVAVIKTDTYTHTHTYTSSHTYIHSIQSLYIQHAWAICVGAKQTCWRLELALIVACRVQLTLLR